MVEKFWVIDTGAGSSRQGARAAAGERLGRRAVGGPRAGGTDDAAGAAAAGPRRRSSTRPARPARPRAWRCRYAPAVLLRRRSCVSLTRLTAGRRLPDDDAAVPRQRAVHGRLPGARRRRRAVVRPKFSASRWIDHVRDSGATVTNFVGVMMDFAWKQPPRDRTTRDNVLRCVFAAPTASTYRRRVQGALRHRGVRRGLRPHRDLRRRSCRPTARTRPAGRRRAAGRRVVRHPARRPRDRPEVAVGEVGELVVRPVHPWTLQQRATTTCPRRPSRRGATSGSTPATRCGATRRAGTTSSTATRTRSAAAARTSAPTRSSRRSSGTRPSSSAPSSRVPAPTGGRRGRGARGRRRPGPVDGRGGPCDLVRGPHPGLRRSRATCASSTALPKTPSGEGPQARAARGRRHPRHLRPHGRLKPERRTR